MPRYSLRTLLILLAIGPPLGAGLWFSTSYTYSGPSNRDTARTHLFLLCDAIGCYQRDVGRVPRHLDDLLSVPTDVTVMHKLNWSGPYLTFRTPLTDPWGRPYQYITLDWDAFLIRSLGPDGEPDTSDDIESY